MSNRTIIITGCGGLLGIEFIKVLLSKGHTVIGTEISDSNINVIERIRTDLTGSERNINTRFSAPGGPEVQSYGYFALKNHSFPKSKLICNQGQKEISR